MKVREIPLDRIFAKKNIRTDTDDELGEQMQSMLAIGQLQPIGVFPRGDRYEIVWGHRRYRAAQMNNEAMIACHILEGITERDIPILKLQENMVRKQLTADEILGAVDAIKEQHPELNDVQVERMLGKSRGYIGYLRSMNKAYAYLYDHGLDKSKLDAMSGTEVMQLRARMENPTKPSRGNKGSFHRKELPSEGFRIVNSPGPNLVVICASGREKLRVLRTLRKLASGE